MIREFNFVCIDCGQPSIAGSATAKRCAECHRIDHNKRQAAHMARKRKDPQFREADRERVRICMQRIRAGNPAKPRKLTFKQELREQRRLGILERTAGQPTNPKALPMTDTQQIIAGDITRQKAAIEGRSRPLSVTGKLKVAIDARRRGLLLPKN